MTATLRTYEPVIPKTLRNRHGKICPEKRPLARSVAKRNRKPLLNISVEQYQAAFEEEFLRERYPERARAMTKQHRQILWIFGVFFTSGVIFAIAAIRFEGVLATLLFGILGIASLLMSAKCWFDYSHVAVTARYQQQDFNNKRLSGWFQWTQVDLLVDPDTNNIILPNAPASLQIPNDVIADAVAIKRSCSDAEFKVEYFDRDPFLITFRRNARGRTVEHYYIRCWNEAGFVA